MFFISKGKMLQSSGKILFHLSGGFGWMNAIGFAPKSHLIYSYIKL